MANHYSHAALPFPVRNARFTIPVPYLDADGDPTDPTTPDTEISKDAGSFADCTEEVSTITGSNGMGYITLTSTEMDASMVCIAAKVASGPKATLAMLSPRILPVLHTGTAQAGANTSITLTSTAPAYDLIGCIVRTTGGTGGGSGGNQARVITAYDTSTKVATVSPAWETNPSSDTTYDVLLTDMASNSPVTRGLRPATDGRTLNVASTGEAEADTIKISGDATAANNAESFFDGTGYAGTNNTIPTVTSLTNAPSDSSGITTLLSRVTEARMGALTDWINGGRLDLLLDALLDRLTETRAGYLDAAISSRLASVGYTAPDNAGITTLLSRITAAVALASDMSTLLTRLSAARAGYLDNLSVGAVAQEATLSNGTYGLNALLTAIGTRLATSGYTAPDNATIAAIAAYLDTEIAAILEDTGTTIPAQISGLNNLSSAQAQSAAAAALAAYDPPTKAEMDAGLALLATAASIAALNNISTAQVLAQATAALNSYDPPTKAELDSAVSPLATAAALATVDGIVDDILVDTGTTIPAQISGLNNLSSAQVTTAVDSALGTAVSEPASLSDKSIKGLLWHLFSRFYHKNTQTASAQTTYKADGTTVLATRAASDDGTTQTLGAAE